MEGVQLKTLNYLHSIESLVTTRKTVKPNIPQLDLNKAFSMIKTDLVGKANAKEPIRPDSKGMKKADSKAASKTDLKEEVKKGILKKPETKKEKGSVQIKPPAPQQPHRLAMVSKKETLIAVDMTTLKHNKILKRVKYVSKSVHNMGKDIVLTLSELHYTAVLRIPQR